MLQGYTVPLSPQGEANRFRSAVERCRRRSRRGVSEGCGSGRGRRELELDLFPVRGEDRRIRLRCTPVRKYRAALCYTVTEVRDLTA